MNKFLIAILVTTLASAATASDYRICKSTADVVVVMCINQKKGIPRHYAGEATLEHITIKTDSLKTAIAESAMPDLINAVYNSPSLPCYMMESLTLQSCLK
jgi:hypothetical protein